MKFLRVAIELKAIEQYFLVVLNIMPYKVVLLIETEDVPMRKAVLL